MRYISTRGLAPSLSFADALLAGLARDGGLYVPETWPTLTPAAIAGLAGLPFHEVAVRVLKPFVAGTIPDGVLEASARAAYATFGHPAVTPLTQIGPNDFVLELFHGPTLAFKDVAMQLVARLMDHVLTERGERATIVCATSGDTGGAAAEAFRGRARTNMVILFPKGRVSDVQRRMMTTPTEANVHPIEIDGTFDDCQAIVKALFNNHAFRDRVKLAGVNSINWGRIVAQVTYYFVAAVALGAPHRRVSFTVPTGNFGDIFAGYVAKRMGLPVDRLVVATNVNDILARTLDSGRYEVRGVAATTSPSMDIQVSSNFERLLFEDGGRDAASVRALMDSLGQSRAFTVPANTLAAIRTGFDAGQTDEAEVATTMRATQAACGYLLDPHTAVAVHVAQQAKRDPAVPMVILSTAHPAKFPEAVAAITAVHPALPERLSRLITDPERMTPLPADAQAVERFIEQALDGRG
ncbi:MAG TPA: threonine synthase [Beijerinckiaceae bacterium]|nr:threonine synthase [Beijerinckiaceae bacterium]